jgi:hypothetical protein
VQKDQFLRFLQFVIRDLQKENIDIPAAGLTGLPLTSSPPICPYAGRQSILYTIKRCFEKFLRSILVSFNDSGGHVDASDSVTLQCGPRRREEPFKVGLTRCASEWHAYTLIERWQTLWEKTGMTV